MNQKPTILFDLDGVVFDWLGGVRSSEKVKKSIVGHLLPSPEDVTSFRYEDCSPACTHDLIKEVISEKGFYRNLKPLPGAVESLKKFDFGSFNGFLCSSPELEYEDSMCHSEKVESVREHLGEEWARRLILTKDKTLVRGEVLLDDKPEVNGIMFPTWEHIHFRTPYTPDDPSVTSFSWQDDWGLDFLYSFADVIFGKRHDL